VTVRVESTVLALPVRLVNRSLSMRGTGRTSALVMCVDIIHMDDET
jgi:hypothetical protein